MNKKSEDIIFAPRPGNIQLNDIVLTSDFDLVPWGIRTFTKSDFGSREGLKGSVRFR